MLNIAVSRIWIFHNNLSTLTLNYKLFVPVNKLVKRKNDRAQDDK